MVENGVKDSTIRVNKFESEQKKIEYSLNRIIRASFWCSPISFKKNMTYSRICYDQKFEKRDQFQFNVKTINIATLLIVRISKRHCYCWRCFDFYLSENSNWIGYYSGLSFWIGFQGINPLSIVNTINNAFIGRVPCKSVANTMKANK